MMSNKLMRECRRQRGLSLMALARAVDSTPSWLVFVEKYGHTPGPELRQRIAAALDATAAELWPETATADSLDVDGTVKVINGQ